MLNKTLYLSTKQNITKNLNNVFKFSQNRRLYSNNIFKYNTSKLLNKVDNKQYDLHNKETENQILRKQVYDLNKDLNELKDKFHKIENRPQHTTYIVSSMYLNIFFGILIALLIVKILKWIYDCLAF